MTDVIFEICMPRRIYADGREFPIDEEPSFWLLDQQNGSMPLRHARTRSTQLQRDRAQFDRH
jgi:hypothetical protein